MYTCVYMCVCVCLCVCIPVCVCVCVCVCNWVALDPAAHISGVVWYEDPAQGALMGYRDNPKYATRSSLTDERRTTMLDSLEETVRRVAPTFKTMRMRLEDRENSEFLAAKIALSDPNNRVRSELKQTGREANVVQLVDMWGNDPEPPENDARRATPVPHSQKYALW